MLEDIIETHSKMIRTGLIGYGRWGTKLHASLSKITDIQFVCSSDDDYRNYLNEADWIVVATPNKTHYSIVKECLLAGKNVFCEKPLTFSVKEAVELYSLADKHHVKLYVSDIQNFRISKFPVKKINFVKRTKMSSASIRDILFNLTYHDIYTLYNHIFDSSIKSVKVLDKKETLNFILEFSDNSYEFLYDLRYNARVHEINGVNQSGQDDIITKMFNFVFDRDSDFEYNRKISLFSIEIIGKLHREIFPNIAVIGAGIFGSTAAWYLSKEGYNVNLFEKNDDIITQASYINQYRLHRGYHYPRSSETAQSSLAGEASFLEFYGDSIVNDVDRPYHLFLKITVSPNGERGVTTCL